MLLRTIRRGVGATAFAVQPRFDVFLLRSFADSHVFDLVDISLRCTLVCADGTVADAVAILLVGPFNVAKTFMAIFGACRTDRALAGTSCFALPASQTTTVEESVSMYVTMDAVVAVGLFGQTR